MVENNIKESFQGTVANIRYNHMAFPWNSPLSFGVQAFVEYNGLIMNDRYRSDVIRITSITGLDDAEIRDAREAKASAHGEYPYEALYGGRNLVLNGYIETGSLQVLDYLEMNIRAAFAPLVESQLKFRWFDIFDSFDDPQSIKEYANPSTSESGNYTALIGNIRNLIIENGFLNWVAPGENYVVRTAEQRTFCDAFSTVKLVIGNELNDSSMGLICCVKNKENYVKMLYNRNYGIRTKPFLSIAVVSGGKEYVIADENLPAGGSEGGAGAVWLRGRKEGNLLTLEYWLTEPTATALPAAYVSEYLSGTDEVNFGDGVLAQWGFGGNQEDISWKLENFNINSMYPGDVEFGARKISPLSFKDEQTSLTKFKRAFQIVMRTSDFRGFSTAQSRKIITPSNASAPVLGRKYPRTYPLKYRSFVSTEIPLEANIISVNNRGTVFTDSIMYLYGPGENINITNLMNGQEIFWSGNLNSGDYLIINSKEETITNSVGANYSEYLSSNSQYIKLEPMWNEIYVSGSKFTSSTKLVVYSRNAFI